MSLINSMLLKLEKKKIGKPSKRVLLPNNITDVDPVSKFISKVNKTEAGKLIITPDQLEKLKAAYADAPASLSPGTPNYQKVMALFDLFDIASIKKISLANIPTLSKIAKELIGDKTESALLKTGLDNDMQDHDHEFYLGDDRTQTGGDGHDHAMIYHNGTPIKTGPAPDDGHIHEM